MNSTKLLNPKLLSGIAFLWALTGVSHGLAATSAEEFLRAAQAAAIRTAACSADADDLASEVALRFLKSRKRNGGEQPSSMGYIVQSVRNVQREWLRRSKRTQPVAEPDEPDGAVLGLSTPVSDPSRHAEFQELFDTLSPAELEVLALLEEGLGERDIAKQTGDSRYRVRTTIERIRKQAEKLLS